MIYCKKQLCASITNTEHGFVTKYSLNTIIWLPLSPQDSNREENWNRAQANLSLLNMPSIAERADEQVFPHAPGNPGWPTRQLKV